MHYIPPRKKKKQEGDWKLVPANRWKYCDCGGKYKTGENFADESNNRSKHLSSDQHQKWLCPELITRDSGIPYQPPLNSLFSPSKPSSSTQQQKTNPTAINTKNVVSAFVTPPNHRSPRPTTTPRPYRPPVYTSNTKSQPTTTTSTTPSSILNSDRLCPPPPFSLAPSSLFHPSTTIQHSQVAATGGFPFPHPYYHHPQQQQQYHHHRSPLHQQPPSSSIAAAATAPPPSSIAAGASSGSVGDSSSSSPYIPRALHR